MGDWFLYEMQYWPEMGRVKHHAIQRDTQYELD